MIRPLAELEVEWLAGWLAGWLARDVLRDVHPAWEEERRACESLAVFHRREDMTSNDMTARPRSQAMLETIFA
jgi:hypothetical protein